MAVVSPGAADEALALMRAHPLGARAALVGDLREDSEPFVLARTPYGTRIVDMLVGDPLPRIC